ncbi:MAG: acyl-CoA dehydrogenase [Deltaproteobacteria bacterium]|uniref:Acyl-CoA dehydrogenase n=1 Tax=Candidatus Zymogenus saltonus TaxID=2844893 RepID=A0A9D8PS74_9DELT|nr:acyl-CoA dehydrogenase [Candidatus Zymogenus saltonus]
MSNLIVDERDQRFVLYEHLEAEKLTGFARYSEFSKDIFDMIIDEARKFAVDVLEPTIEETEREGCTLKDGSVSIPKCLKEAYRIYCEGGWVAPSQPADVGGQGLPVLLQTAAREYFNCNTSFLPYPGLAEGAALLIRMHGTDQQKKKYMEKMFTGEWGGTMALTEPGAGTDVGSLTTSAKKNPDGSYSITGTKIFITAGDHDLVDNIVHAVLARVEGAPSGTKGISIFLVPKYLVNDDGSLGERNDYSVTGIEKKMGFNGSATCLMNFGDNGKCYGELLGEEGQGMKVMFILMNEARVAVALQGLTCASRAYLNSVKYAKERIQGPDLINFRNPEAPRVPIINHPDVRRMLLWMKSHTEGLRALTYYTSKCEDLSLALDDPEEREKWHGMVELLTPVIKACGSDIGFQVADQSIMVHGGYGYTKEYPVEQILRDVKLSAIYEGTNGVQALDLVGRKLGQKKGENFKNLIGEINKFIREAGNNGRISGLVDKLKEGVKILTDTSEFFAACGREGKFLVPIGNAYPFLNLMATIMLSWMLAWQAKIAGERLDALTKEKGVDPNNWIKWAEFLNDDRNAAFYSGKLAAAKYFINNVMPKAEAIAKAIKTEDLSIMEIAEVSFAF